MLFLNKEKTKFFQGFSDSNILNVCMIIREALYLHVSIASALIRQQDCER